MLPVRLVQYLECSLLLLVTAASDLSLCTIKLCSVVFGVTLRLLAINTLPPISREQEMTPLTTDESHQLATVRRSCVYTWRSQCWQHVMKPDIGEYHNFCLPHLHLTPSLGGLHWNIAIVFRMEKIEWCGYPTAKNVEDTFICFHRIQERDRQTDKQTDGQTPHNGIGHTYT